ncbi:conserved hypothetical protein [Nitrosococcus halophilus Nc 4]|uniref:Lysozyme family protein n=1 Tax=Nitrosococcus halophilus (strain Nc4) TaxID=472759 RepID=D5C2J9_NITHN|nr:hypothetical protein [Nitrosococcus halophilus]ADE14858.1 conserved hypothetical protein [Nitrosococcus halophilus Nc 4]
MPSVSLTKGLRSEYQTLFDSCVIDSGKSGEVEALITKLGNHRERYFAVAEALNIPWYFITVIHNMESSQDFSCHLHNGDPLSARTVHVPQNRPPKGLPPFSWEESAIDALKLKRLHRWQDWSVAGLLYKLEGYNGWGYRLYHPHVLSPYLWGYSSHYKGGKYTADGRWSDAAVSKQCGTATLLRRMAEKALVELPLPPLKQSVARHMRQGLSWVRYSSQGPLPYARELQEFLNTFPGIYIKPDGWPGEKTSEAFQKVTGYYLQGDPRVGQ